MYFAHLNIIRILFIIFSFFYLKASNKDTSYSDLGTYERAQRIEIPSVKQPIKKYEDRLSCIFNSYCVTPFLGEEVTKNLLEDFVKNFLEDDYTSRDLFMLRDQLSTTNPSFDCFLQTFKTWIKID